MVFNTLTVVTAVAPTVISTAVSHFTNRQPLKEKPTAHLSYHLGLQLVRQFIVYASHHTVEDIQGFTAQWVPTPRWVRVENISIPIAHIEEAVRYLQKELGPRGIEAVGGSKWWQWRPEDQPLKAEWLEMRKDYNARKEAGGECRRCMLYVHGGAFYFGSVDEHRYQIQRHARKLQARVLSPRYRLAPQYPFPCGLLDCLAAYLYLLTVQPPETIVFAGDSAGGGMIVSLLVILRDQGLPLPAGGILMSPWVDLTHSFPSVAGFTEQDYVPAQGFAHRPSMAWPPPNADDMATIKALAAKQNRSKPSTSPTQPHLEPPLDSIHEISTHNGPKDPTHPYTPNLTITVDGTTIEITDQIQMYTTNTLLSHPLVTPVLQPSLGGLPPLLILVGGGEMLRDEQIYLAEKAACPQKYAPSDAYLKAQGERAGEEVGRWPPTNVQLQVWQDLCHVAPTLSFTRPAKWMYRSVAQFGAWCLARAQRVDIEIVEDDDVSVVSTGSSSSLPGQSANKAMPASTATAPTSQRITGNATDAMATTAQAIGTAGSPLPRFNSHIIRQLVTRHGIIYPLPPAESLPACQMSPSDVGTIKPGPVLKWLHTQAEYSKRYVKEGRALKARRVREMNQHQMAGKGATLLLLEGENPPPSAMARRVMLYGVESVPRRAQGWGGRRKKFGLGSFGLNMWTGWGSKHDSVAVGKEETIERDERREVRKVSVVVDPTLMKGRDGGARHGSGSALIEQGRDVDGDVGRAGEERAGGRLLSTAWQHRQSRSRSHSRVGTRKKSVAYEGQIEGEIHEPLPLPPPAPVPQSTNTKPQETILDPERLGHHCNLQPPQTRPTVYAPVVLPPVIAVSAAEEVV